MTPDQRLQTELTHLLNLCAPPFTRGWWPYCKAKAAALAAQEPRVFAELPRLLEEGVRSLSKSTQTAPSIGAQEKSDAR